MKAKLLLIANLALFVLALMILGSVQTSLWFQIFGYFPSPALWIPCLIYVALYRSTLETIIFAYLAGFTLSTMSAMPEGLLMLLCVALALTARLFKRRIYWETSSYMMMTCGLAALVFHLYHWGASFFIGDYPLTSPNIMDWLIEALLTPLAAPPLLPLFRWFDRITERDNSEMAAHVS